MDDALAAMADDFDLLGDWEARIQHVIDLGRSLPPLRDDERIAANKVPGCTAQVWVTSQRRPRRTASVRRRLRLAVVEGQHRLAPGAVFRPHARGDPGVRRPRGARSPGFAVRTDPAARQRLEFHGAAHPRRSPSSCGVATATKRRQATAPACQAARIPEVNRSAPPTGASYPRIISTSRPFEARGRRSQSTERCGAPRHAKSCTPTQGRPRSTTSSS